MTPAQLLDAKARALGAYGRHLATAMGGKVYDSDTAVLCNSGRSAQRYNLVIPSRSLTDADCERLHRHAVAFYGDSQAWVVFSVYAQPPSMGRQFRRIETTPIMWRASRTPLVATTRPGLTLDEVRDDEQLARFERLREAGYGRKRPDQHNADLDARVLDVDRGGNSYRCWIGYLGGEPVGTASIFDTGEVTLIKNITTLAPFRSRGIGEFLSAHAVNHGRGISMLDSSLTAQPLYVRLGFETIGTMEFWKLR